MISDHIVQLPYMYRATISAAFTKQVFDILDVWVAHGFSAQHHLQLTLWQYLDRYTLLYMCTHEQYHISLLKYVEIEPYHVNTRQLAVSIMVQFWEDERKMGLWLPSGNYLLRAVNKLWSYLLLYCSCMALVVTISEESQPLPSVEYIQFPIK